MKERGELTGDERTELTGDKRARILLVEDDEGRCAWFRSRFSGRQMDVTCDVREAIRWLETRDYGLIFLDHDLTAHNYEQIAFNYKEEEDMTGYRVACWLAEHADRQREATIIVHSLNYVGAQRMIQLLQDAGFDAEYIPFTILISGLRY